MSSFDKVLKTYHLAKRELGEILSSCEMMDRLSIDVSINNLGMKNPLTSHEFYMLIETSGSHLAHDEEKLSSFVEKAMNNDIIEDGTLTNETAKVNVCKGLNLKIQKIENLRHFIILDFLYYKFSFKYSYLITVFKFFQIEKIKI